MLRRGNNIIVRGFSVELCSSEQNDGPLSNEDDDSTKREKINEKKKQNNEQFSGRNCWDAGDRRSRKYRYDALVVST